MCCNSWGCEESDMTEQLNRTELNICIIKRERERERLSSICVKKKKKCLCKSIDLWTWGVQICGSGRGDG